MQSDCDVCHWFGVMSKFSSAYFSFSYTLAMRNDLYPFVRSLASCLTAGWMVHFVRLSDRLTGWPTIAYWYATRLRVRTYIKFASTVNWVNLHINQYFSSTFTHVCTYLPLWVWGGYLDSFDNNYLSNSSYFFR